MQAIRSRYVAVRPFYLTRLVLFLGSAFLGTGPLWLVATNLADISPLQRFDVSTALWLGSVVTAKVLAE